MVVNYSGKINISLYDIINSEAVTKNHYFIFCFILRYNDNIMIVQYNRLENIC